MKPNIDFYLPWSAVKAIMARRAGWVGSIGKPAPVVASIEQLESGCRLYHLTHFAGSRKPAVGPSGEVIRGR